MNILNRMQKVPGGLMVVPLLIGAFINTFMPGIINIGGFTQSLGTAGFATICAANMFCVGTNLTLKGAPKVLKKGFAILFAKVGIACLVAFIVAKVFNSNFLGLSTLAVLSAMNDTNGGMFIALTTTMGDSTDVGANVVQSVETGPFITMVILSGTGLAAIPYLSMVSVLVPILLGALLGNLDKNFREFFGKRASVLIPFLGFALGNGINLKSVVSGGLSGILLGILTVTLTGAVCILADKLTGGSGIAGAAASTTAGNAVATPNAIAMADPTFAAIAPIASLQVAASVIITAFLTPVLTAMVYKRNNKKKQEKEAAEELQTVG
jgi:2-keto-3-deoxygluconate permease